MTEPRPETDADQRVLRDIADRGWHVVVVDEISDRPGWAFSIGLQRSFGHPEVVVFGLPERANREIVDRVARDVAAGRPHPAGSACDTILAGLRCELRAVAREWHTLLLGYATWYYGGDDFSAVQLLWPDRDDRLPDRTDFDPDLAGLQPLLEHASAERAGLGDLLHALDRL